MTTNFRAVIVGGTGSVGNATPAWAALLGRLFPFSFGTIAQTDLAQSFVHEIAFHGGDTGEVVHGNKEMRANGGISMRNT